MATPGTTTYPKGRHNITIGDAVWRTIQVRAVELGVPAGEVVDRAFSLVLDIEALRNHPLRARHESPAVLLLRAKLVRPTERA